MKVGSAKTLDFVLKSFQSKCKFNVNFVLNSQPAVGAVHPGWCVHSLFDLACLTAEL